MVSRPHDAAPPASAGGTLLSPAVTGVLEAITALGAANDAAARAGFRAARAGRDSPFAVGESVELYRDAALAVKPAVGRLLYVLARARGPRCIVEFGTSFGASAIHLAAALRDAGGGRLITSEFHPDKARLAGRHLAEAGLADLVEVRVGDALETLREIDGPVDLLFLDGFGDTRLAVLRLVEPRLRAGALVVADQSTGDPYWSAYADYVRDPTQGYASVNLPLDAGVELSVRL